MIIRHAIAALTFLLFCKLSAQESSNYHCLWDECSFKPEQLVYTFGDKVKLRAEPNTEAKVLDFIRIGHPVRIIEKSEVYLSYNGYESPFFKVFHEGMTGYVLGNLLSLERKSLGELHYLFTYKQEGDASFLLVRSVGSDGDYDEQQIPLANTMIQLKKRSIDGIEGLNEVLVIDYLAEACGVEGGRVYLFPNQNGTLQPIALSQVSEAGIFWYNEELFFPDDENGVPNTIVYKKESYKNLDEDTEWIETSAVTRKLKWTNGKLTPNPFKPESLKQ